MIKNKYKDNYKKTTYIAPDGSVKEITYYQGEYYSLPYGKKTLNRNCLICWFFTVLFLILFIAGGWVNPDSSHIFWIVFPYLFLFLPIGYQLVGCVSLISTDVRMEKAVYDNSILRIKHSAQAILVLSIINILLEIIYIIVNFKNAAIAKELLYLLCISLMLVVCIIFGKLFDKMFSKIKIENIR